MRKEIGKYFIDISKLVFGGVVLSGILGIEDVSRATLLSIGILTTLILALGGFLLIKEEK